MGLEKGVNLTPLHQQQWANNTWKICIQTMFIFVSSFILALIISFFNQQKSIQINILRQHISEITDKQENITQQLNQFMPNTPNFSQLVKKENIERIINSVLHIPVKNAGISIVRLYIDEQVKLKIVGTYQQQQDFELLEKYFTEHGFLISIEYLQTKQEAKADFSLILTDKQEE